MFSGIVEEIGMIKAVTDSEDGRRLTIEAPRSVADGAIGESISVSGTCLTVVSFDERSFDVEATHETLKVTTTGELAVGSRVNLEKALKVSDRLGGHLVTGHVDTIARISKVEKEGFSRLVTFSLDELWAPFFVKKGSVTVDGVSLTVVDCPDLPITDVSCKDEQAAKRDDGFWFSVALIPHTMEVTTLSDLTVGKPVNIETDVVARYIVRLVGAGYMENLNKVRESVPITGGNS